MRLACGFDHAGEALRETVLGALRRGGHEADDLGVADDYPDVALAVARAVHGGTVGSAVAAELVVAFAGAAFSGEERHARRLARVQALEDRGWGSGA